MHFSITAARDISIYPSQGTLVTSDGQQADADTYNGDDFDGDIAKGVTKDGYVLWELEKMTDPKAIKTLRVKFHANYETDDMDDDNAYKDFDFTINL
jgi:lysozyme family protein